MIRRLLLPALLLATALPAAASESPLRRLDGAALAKILQDEGYRAKLGTDDDGDPMVETRMGGLNVQVYTYDCVADGCGSVQFSAGLDLPEGSTYRIANDYNLGFRYARMFLDEEMDPYLQMDIEVLHTDPAAHLASHIAVWEELLDEFTRVTGFHDQGEDDNGKAAPVEASSLAARDP